MQKVVSKHSANDFASRGGANNVFLCHKSLIAVNFPNDLTGASVCLTGGTVMQKVHV